MTARGDWLEQNQRYLTAALARLAACLEPAAEVVGGDPEAIRAAMSAPPALDAVGDAFGLSPFERDLLLLCAGIELDAAVAALCGRLLGDPGRPCPTFGLALTTLTDPHWSALAPDAPLRRWRMLEVGAGATLVTSPLRIDERILHHLAGIGHLDERLAGLVEPVEAPAALAPSQRAVAHRVAETWSAGHPGPLSPIIQLAGSDASACRDVAAAVCEELGCSMAALSGQALPVAAAELDGLVRLWQREAVLGGCALLVEAADVDAGDTARDWALTRLLERVGPALVTVGDRRRALRRPSAWFDVARPTRDEQRRLWRTALGGWAELVDGDLDSLVGQFDSGPARIAEVTEEALTTAPSSGRELGARLWDGCRVRARPRLDDLAQRLVPTATWDDLVLPGPQLDALRHIGVHARRRVTVYESWGFAARSARGLGISALFAGPSGTGKTLAAEVLARDLRLDLYRIDLSQVVSKYIGETEKNLRRIFDAAEEGGVVLLFDEADALFGRRTEIRDSHDRYANIEVSYLLQRMEAYRGLAILTTNARAALDPAFLRRLRFIVQFPFPDAEQRAGIWRRAFPASAPTEGLDPGVLARMNVAGGNIASIALSAAFLAADSGQPVGMAHVVAAARTEFAKLEKPFTEAELGGR